MPKADAFFALGEFIADWAAGDRLKEAIVVIATLAVLLATISGILSIMRGG